MSLYEQLQNLPDVPYSLDGVTIIVVLASALLFYMLWGSIDNIVRSVICAWRHKHDCKSKCFLWDCPCYCHCPHNCPYEKDEHTPLWQWIKSLFKKGDDEH